MPFVLAPNFWSKFSLHNNNNSAMVERAHGDGIKVNTESPEAFEEVFWKTFSEENNESKKNLKIMFNSLIRDTRDK